MWLGSSLPFNGNNLNLNFFILLCRSNEKIVDKKLRGAIKCISSYFLFLFYCFKLHKICCISEALQNVFYMSK